MNNFMTFLFCSGLAVFIYSSNLDRECKKARNRLESVALAKTINIMSYYCSYLDYKCVNSALLYKEEMLELVNTELKDLGCR